MSECIWSFGLSHEDVQDRDECRWIIIAANPGTGLPGKSQLKRCACVVSLGTAYPNAFQLSTACSGLDDSNEVHLPCLNVIRKKMNQY